jgi:hypothetical protein
LRKSLIKSTWNWKNIFKAIIFLKCTQWQRILSFDNSTAMFQDLKTLHPGGIQNRVFCSGGGRDVHYATPPLHTVVRKLIFSEKNQIYSRECARKALVILHWWVFYWIGVSLLLLLRRHCRRNFFAMRKNRKFGFAICPNSFLPNTLASVLGYIHRWSRGCQIFLGTTYHWKVIKMLALSSLKIASW